MIGTVFNTLRSDYEGLRSSILHRSPLSSVDSIVIELLTEKIHLQSYSEKKILSASNPSVLVVLSKPLSNHQNSHTQKLASMSAISVSRKVIGRLSVPS